MTDKAVSAENTNASADDGVLRGITYLITR